MVPDNPDKPDTQALDMEDIAPEWVAFWHKIYELDVKLAAMDRAEAKERDSMDSVVTERVGVISEVSSVTQALEAAVIEDRRYKPPEWKLSHDLQELPWEVEAIWVTPEMARQGLDKCPFPFQRNLNTHGAEALADAMRCGNYVPTTSYFATLGQHTYMLDGQHRYNGVVRANKPVLFWQVHVRVETRDELVAIYCGLDRGKRRYPRDQSRATAFLGSGDAQPDSGVSRLLNDVYKTIGFGFGPQQGGNHFLNTDAQLRHSFKVEWWDSACIYLDAVDGAMQEDRHNWTRAPVAAVGIVACRWQPEKASDFFAHTSSNAMLAKDSPHLRLLGKIRQDYNGRTKTKKSGQDRGVGAFTLQRQVAYCWNQFFDGKETIKNVRVQSDEEPILIKGTPYDGKKVLKWAEDHRRGVKTPEIWNHQPAPQEPSAVLKSSWHSENTAAPA